jgi:hypothetical protein
MASSFRLVKWPHRKKEKETEEEKEKKSWIKRKE